MSEDFEKLLNVGNLVINEKFLSLLDQRLNIRTAVLSFHLFILSGFHRHLHGGDGPETSGHGPVLLLPGQKVPVCLSAAW